MFFPGLIILAGILILGVIFIAGAAFWIIFGIRKFRWALITSIVLSVLFVIAGGMLSYRIISASADGYGKLGGRMSRIESRIDRIAEPGFLGKRVAADLRRLERSDGPEIEFSGIEEEKLEEIRENRDKIETIIVNVDVEIEYKEEQ